MSENAYASMEFPAHDFAPRYTDPETTKGWGIVDFDWSNGKGTGTADGWAKHQPMDDEEMLFKQVKMTTAATKGTTVWVYRCR